MTIRVLLFATLAQRTGVREAALELPAGATAGDAAASLRERYPALRELEGKVATAVNLAYVGQDHPLQDGDELALIPPVSGG